MAEVTVSFVLHKLFSFDSFLQDNVQLMQGVREELEDVRNELQHMQAFLRHADAVEDSNLVEPRLRVWVNHIREVAYDTEDIVDEFLLHLSHTHDHGFPASLHNISCFIKTMKPRYRIASDVQGIKIRVSQVSAQYKKYMIGQKSDEPVSYFTGASQRYAPLPEKVEDELVGMDKKKEELISWLVKGSPGRDVIPVFGTGGLGKTTLARQAYEDAAVKKHFSVQLWVVVSRSFQMEELFHDMARQIYTVTRKSIPEDLKHMPTNQVLQTIKDLLAKSRYLVILDDVWETDAWDVIKFALPNNNQGSRVVITTRNARVASSSCQDPQGRVLTLNPLPQEDCWALFRLKTFQGKSCPEKLESICNSILKKCGGLPLAVVAVSGVLATKDEANLPEWEHVLTKLGYGKLSKVLSLSFKDLPYHLKSCYLYMSIFPEDHLIEHMRLVRLWIAEGFVIVKEGSGRTPEEVAEDYLQELISRNLIQKAGMSCDGRVKTYRIHDLFRELIISKSREHHFAIAAKEDMKWPEKTRHLSVMNKLEEGLKKRAVPKLRSFLAFNVVNPITEFSTYGFRLLNVLDMQGTPLEVFPAEIVKLCLLKYLSLRGTMIKDVPRSIKKLQNLETLDLKGTLVTELPVEIQRLKKLRHLLVYRYEMEAYDRFNSKTGFKSLAEIGCLESLQKLCFIEANEGSVVEELGKLTQLRKLGIIKFSRHNGVALCSSLEKMQKLGALSLTSISKDEIIDLNHLTYPPQTLARIYLTGRMEKLPKWISSLKNLSKLFLRWSLLEDDPLALIQDLPNLMHLELQQAYQGEQLFFKSGGFPKLKTLGLDDLEKLTSVRVERGAMPLLENLVLQRCRLLWTVPSGIEHLYKLKVVEFFDMPTEFLMKLYPGEGEDYWRVEHVPEVYSSYFRKNGLWEAYRIESFKETESSGRPCTSIWWSLLERTGLSKRSMRRFDPWSMFGPSTDDDPWSLFGPSTEEEVKMYS